MVEDCRRVAAILVPPGVSQDIEAGGDAELAEVAFCKSVLDPEMLGAAADGIFSMIGSARGPAAPEPLIGVTRLFARQTGMHMFEYLNRVRIQKSCLLLKRSSMSIVEIAFAVGCNNLSHFNRYFRRIMEMSPRAYRNSRKKQ
jgi:hypothetical protein